MYLKLGIKYGLKPPFRKLSTIYLSNGLFSIILIIFSLLNTYDIVKTSLGLSAGLIVYLFTLPLVGAITFIDIENFRVFVKSIPMGRLLGEKVLNLLAYLLEKKTIVIKKYIDHNSH